jgi:OTU domain-containing protein 6
MYNNKYTSSHILFVFLLSLSLSKTGKVCADHLLQHEEDFGPFCEYTDTITSFGQYVDRVRSSSDWGGHLELRAISEALKRSIVVYSASQPKLILGEEIDDDCPILLSYHLHYYTLGEHYNQIVPIVSDKDS